jgi:hypothetical protein
MEITVERYSTSKTETIGKLFINGIFMCYTLEDAFNDVKVAGETRIPVGTYKIGMRTSPRFSAKYGHKMLWIKDVPNYQYILIHKGNVSSDTEGCLLVGSYVGTLNGKRAVLNSDSAYKKIYPIISSALLAKEEVVITYKDLG